MKLVIDIPDRIYKLVQNKRLNIIDGKILEQALANGTPLPEGAEILTKEAYSDLCTRAADVLDFESKEYVEERVENYNKLLKSGMLDCVIEKSQESEG